MAAGPRTRSNNSFNGAAPNRWRALGLPSVLFSIALRHFAVQTAMIGFAAVLSCGAMVSVAVALRDRAPGPGALSAQSARPS